MFSKSNNKKTYLNAKHLPLISNEANLELVLSILKLKIAKT